MSKVNRSWMAFMGYEDEDGRDVLVDLQAVCHILGIVTGEIEKNEEEVSHYGAPPMYSMKVYVTDDMYEGLEWVKNVIEKKGRKSRV